MGTACVILIQRRIHKTMDSHPSRKNDSLKDFFLLVIGLSIPIWLVGGARLPLPVKLPVSALTAFVPAIAAAILSFRRRGPKGMRELLQMSWDYRKIRSRVWYVPVLLLAPFLYLLAYVIMWVTERPLPDPIHIPFLWLPVFVVLYLITGAGEELGWSGYATEPMQERRGALVASFLLGILWAVWHSIAFIQTGEAAEWVVWQSIKTIAMRMIIVWIYNGAGKSVFAATAYHTADNVSWSLFPNTSSHYDPLAMALVNCAAVIVIFLGGGFKGHAAHPEE